jgi:hypothetical protein
VPTTNDIGIFVNVIIVDSTHVDLVSQVVFFKEWP